MHSGKTANGEYIWWSCDDVRCNGFRMEKK